jgi:hypothetical protein
VEGTNEEVEADLDVAESGLKQKAINLHLSTQSRFYLIYLAYLVAIT